MSLLRPVYLVVDLYKRGLHNRSVHAFDILGDPVRRRILELLAGGEVSAGEVAEVVRAEFGISQPAVSQHLRVLREAGFTQVRPEGTRRIYALRPEALHEVDEWLSPFRKFWEPRLAALGTEIARGKRAQRPSPARGHQGNKEKS